MSNVKRTSVLWVDDQIEHYEPYCEVLWKFGFDVKTASSAEEALKMAKAETFDIFLIDLRMPSPDGVDLLRQLHILKNQKRALFAAFSSFLYLSVYRDRMKGLGFPVQLIDKDFPPTDSPELFERFVAPVKSLAEDGIQHSISGGKITAPKELGIDPFSIPLSEFLRLPLNQKESLLDKAERIASSTIERALSEGKIWVLLCGSPDVIRVSASKPSQILSEEEIMEYARRLRCAPYQFFGGHEPVEDMWMSCHMDHYPTVTLEFPSDRVGGEGVKVDMHFDTGAPMCFFSYEDLLNMGVVKPTQLVGKKYIRKGYGGTEYRALTLKKDAILECQRGKGTKAVKLYGQIVRDWIQSPYARICDRHCECLGEEPSEGDDHRLCPFRKGLVGRNILVENRLKLVLDGKTKKTGFEKKG